MNNTFIFPDTLEAAQAAGIAASNIETRTSYERGSSYTSARVEILINGEKFARALMIVTRINGGYDYGQQLARDAMKKLELGFDQFTFFATRDIKAHDHFVKTKYTEMTEVQ